MARSFVTIALALAAFGCASAGGVRPDPDDPRYSLRRTHEERRAVYAREQTVRVLGTNFSVQYRARSVVEVRPFAPGRYLVHQTFELPTYQEDGAPAALPAQAQLLDGAQTRSVVDVGNRLVEGPELTARRRGGSVLEGALLALARGLRLTYPASSVAVGEGWAPDPVRISLQAPISITLEVEPSFVLAAIEVDADGARFASIEWRGEIRIPGFEAMGMTLEGRGAISGLSRVALDDGTAGSTDLDVRLSVGPRSTSEVVSLLSATLKYRDEMRPSSEPARTLIDGVRPVDPRS